MNFLGHIYLSGNNDQLMIGNFIGDYVKGNKYTLYPEGIQQGILLHRAIDSYTDTNTNFLILKETLKPVYNRYAGVVTDLFIDHFLAANWNNYHPVPLEEYTQQVYRIMKDHYEYFPTRLQGFFSNLVERDRLLSYREISGLEEALMIMAFRTSLPGKSSEAISLLKNNYETLNATAISFLNEITLYISEVVQTGLHPTGAI